MFQNAMVMLFDVDSGGAASARDGRGEGLGSAKSVATKNAAAVKKQRQTKFRFI